MKPAPEKLSSLDTLVDLLGAPRAAGRTVVLANGAFDLLHVGHVRYLRGAAALGDIGETARSAVPALEKVLDDRSPAVREAAAQALDKIKK